VGGIAALLVLTRFDFAFLAARGYIDVPYMALVVWAAVLEARRPRCGTPVLVLLALAGLLRPEAWLLSGLYWLWLSWRAPWRDRIRWALLVGSAPILWFATDLIVTGDPLFSLHYTSSSAEDLGRQRTLSEIPSAVPDFFRNLVKLPVFLAGLAGIVLGALVSPRRMTMPAVLLASGLATFVAIAVAGLSVIERYLIVAALALIIFAAVAVGGFTMLRAGTWARRLWLGVALALVLYGVVFTATRVNLTRLEGELRFRGDAHAALADVLDEPAVRDALACGPLTVPNHKLVPDAAWLAGLRADEVLPRADPKAGTDRIDRGVALVVTSRFAMFRHAWTSDTDPAAVEVPPAGWTRVATSPYVAAYARC
jgi:hypothetical protein